MASARTPCSSSSAKAKFCPMAEPILRKRKRFNHNLRLRPSLRKTKEHPIRHWALKVIPAFLLAVLAYFRVMPSFDIVSQVNSMEIENAVNQAQKEMVNRFDFKGSKWEIVLEKDEIKLTAEDQFKIQALADTVMGKLAKRSISLKNVERAEPDVSPLGHARQSIKIKQGLEQTVAKQVTNFIREGKYKVTTQIQGN